MRYIGSKQRILEELSQFIDEKIDGNEETFLDLFAGTNTVGNHFKPRFTIYSNDILYFCYCIAKAKIENSGTLNFENLKQIGIEDPLKYLNESKINKNEIGYYEYSYTPSGSNKRMYFTSSNGKRIDFIRDTIDSWKQDRLINEFEYYYLITCLLEAVSLVSNTTGTYGAYLKKWDKRALKQIKLDYMPITDNKRNNIAYNCDANNLVKKIYADVVYVDPPYNSRQYASNYHVLENIAVNDKPELAGVTGLMNYDSKKSDYSMKSKVLDSFKDLVKNINCKHLFISYNTEGLLHKDEIVKILKENAIDGIVTVKNIAFERYNSKIKSNKSDLQEIIFYIKKKEEKVKNISKTVSYEQITFPFIKNEFIKSPLNYIGGKYKVLEQIIPLFPNEIKTFVDLFSGGANVGINVNAENYIFNDMNIRLNEMFRYFKGKNPDLLVENIIEIIEEFNLSKDNEESYLKFRELYNSQQKPLYLYVLSSFSYNYQIRFNNNMKYNNPFGRNRSHFSNNMKNNLVKFVDRLNQINAIFTDKLFQEFDFSSLDSQDFVYLDPPYLITTGNYNDGNRGFKNWGIEEELFMYEILKRLHQNNIRWALSNVIEHKGQKNEYLLRFIKEHPEFIVNEIRNTFSNSSYNTKRSSSKEILLTNYNVLTGEINKI